MADLDRLIHRLYRVVALEPNWEQARTLALNELIQWSNAHSAFWLTGAAHNKGPLQSSTTPITPDMRLALTDTVRGAAAERGEWLESLPPGLADSSGVATRGFLVDYQHRDAQLSSRVLIRFSGSSPFPSEVMFHAVGHLVEVGTLALDLLLARDSWLGAMGRAARGASALIDDNGLYYAVSPSFRTLINSSFGSNISSAQLPAPLPSDALSAAKPFVLGKLQARVSPQGPLWLLHLRSALPIDKLSPREQEVARHLSEGKTFKRIAQQLGLSPSTVANHSASIYRKLGVFRREDLISQVRTEVTRKAG